MHKHLGKIESVRFGLGGYQDQCIGLTVHLASGGSGVADFFGPYCPGLIEVNERTKWTEEDRDKELASTMRRIADLLVRAKKSEVSALAGVPVEIEFEGNLLKSWRILDEVL
ncbi:hypothetical protein SAMN04488503_2266 [Humidesulfovibrio mexicanus]|uniref:Uncharacterized protein n=1 Tax=Humidesulfovibrio mexicanus TaxID=147047 RepID=A0A239AY23_9BACT|nr:hypothetical protein [Humidesulfovibrio mexicanus]SNR99924.1 hypothetical protein SAMN04488503_2266 [Humidesulfovibrio mexicanus]